MHRPGSRQPGISESGTGVSSHPIRFKCPGGATERIGLGSSRSTLICAPKASIRAALPLPWTNFPIGAPEGHLTPKLIALHTPSQSGITSYRILKYRPADSGSGDGRRRPLESPVGCRLLCGRLPKWIAWNIRPCPTASRLLPTRCTSMPPPNRGPWFTGITIMTNSRARLRRCFASPHRPIAPILACT